MIRQHRIPVVLFFITVLSAIGTSWNMGGPTIKDLAEKQQNLESSFNAGMETMRAEHKKNEEKIKAGIAERAEIRTKLDGANKKIKELEKRNTEDRKNHKAAILTIQTQLNEMMASKQSTEPMRAPAGTKIKLMKMTDPRLHPSNSGMKITDFACLIAHTDISSITAPYDRAVARSAFSPAPPAAIATLSAGSVAMYYYEVTLLFMSKNSDIFFGFSTTGGNEQETMKGLFVAFGSDGSNGYRLLASPFKNGHRIKDTKITNAEWAFSQGDVIGVGLTVSAEGAKRVFFTVNGAAKCDFTINERELGNTIKEIWPMVEVKDAPATAKMNFGQDLEKNPFRYQIYKHRI